MTPTDRRQQVFPDADALADALAAAVLEHAAAAIRSREEFLLVLAGGSTPRAAYQRLAASQADWDRWRIYFGDERCLPAGDAERNDTMAREAWLDRVPIPQQNLYPIPAELGPAEGARRYAELLAGVGSFDLVLLGLGEDGHTASLFPGDPPGEGPGSPDVLAVHDAPKPPPERISLGAARLSRCRAMTLAVSGASKRVAVTALQAGEDIPASSLAPPGGLDLMLDRAAAGEGD